LEQLRELAEKPKVPIVCAGDVFDRWQSCPELINWAIKHLPMMYAIPGQHDLPHHSLDEINKSAYWTLVEAKIGNVHWEDRLTVWTRIPGLVLYGFPWGKQISPVESRGGNVLRIAVAHRYIWTQGKQYAGASNDSHWSSFRKQLDGYDVAVFGDNHKPFEIETKDCLIFNCGCLIPRSADERDHEPSVGLLYDDKHIERHYLDISQDKWLDLPEQEMWRAQENEKLTKFLDDLKTLGSTALDFHRAVLRFMDENEVDDGVRKALLEAIGE